MKHILYLILLIFGFSYDIIGQDTTISKNNIIKIFKDNAKGTTFDWKKRGWSDSYKSTYRAKYNAWLTCNDDSIYYKTDTLTLYNHNLYYFNLNCEWLKQWSFSSKKYITIMDIRPPMGVVTLNNIFRVIEENSKVFIIIKDSKEVIDKFLVIRLNIVYQGTEKKEKCYKMTLKRIHKENN
jgi:hypothetical protein